MFFKDNISPTISFFISLAGTTWVAYLRCSRELLCRHRHSWLSEALWSSLKRYLVQRNTVVIFSILLRFLRSIRRIVSSQNSQKGSGRFYLAKIFIMCIYTYTPYTILCLILLVALSHSHRNVVLLFLVHSVTCIVSWKGVIMLSYLPRDIAHILAMTGLHNSLMHWSWIQKQI